MDLYSTLSKMLYIYLFFIKWIDSRLPLCLPNQQVTRVASDSVLASWEQELVKESQKQKNTVSENQRCVSFLWAPLKACMYKYIHLYMTKANSSNSSCYHSFLSPLIQHFALPLFSAKSTCFVTRGFCLVSKRQRPSSAGKLWSVSEGSIRQSNC